MTGRRALGPGLLLAATSIGGSHLLMAPTAGARFGYALLWLVLVAHLVKYHAFEFGPRVALAADMSLLGAYRRLPGPRDWVLWMGSVDMVVESVGVLAAVAGLTGSVLHGAFGGPGLPIWTLLVILAVYVLLFTGRYGLLRLASMVMLVVLALGTAVAFLAAPPSLRDLSHLVRPSLPTGSLLVVASILGWMPTGVGISVWHSLWIREDPRFARRPGESPREHLRRGLADMRVGYGLSAVLGVMFLCLGAAVLHPRGLVPEGVQTALTLQRLYTELLGGWMGPVFLLVAFFAMFSTTYAVMDGMPRTLTAAVRHLRGQEDPDRADRGRVYWSYLVGMTVASLTVVTLVPDPVKLITVLGAVTFLLNPLYCLLNYWCATRVIQDPALRPGALDRGVAKAGILLMVGIAGLLFYTELLLRAEG